MPNIKPISDLRNYSEVLHDVAVGAPVFLTKNGWGKYAIIDIQDYEKTQATVGKITKSMRILETHAYAGALLSSIADIDSDYRFLVSGNYLVFYRVCENDIYVDRVLHGRRDYMRVLFDGI